MKKRIFAMGILSFYMIVSLVSPFLGQSIHQNQDITEEIKNIEEETTSELKQDITIQHFVGLGQTTEEETTVVYPNLYADFTQEEIYMIQRCVETETYTADVISKMNVASVIFNRLNHPDNKYGDNVVEIITAPNQFAYWRTEISKETVQAIENVYKYGDTTNGCIAYRSDNPPEYWSPSPYHTWVRQFIDAVGHGFYKEITEKGDK